MKSRKNNKPFNLGAVYTPTTNVLFGRVVTVLLLSCFGAVAQASLITVNWSGTVTSSEILRVIDTGDTVTGSYTFDSSASVSTTEGSYSKYDTAHVSSFSINGLSGSTSDNEIAVYNNHITLGDQFDSRGYGEYTGHTLDGLIVQQIFIRFNDSTATAYSDTSLHTSLNTSDFDNTFTSRLDLFDPNIDVFANVQFIVESFEFAPVPVPPALWLFGSGLLVLIGISRRKKT